MIQIERGISLKQHLDKVSNSSMFGSVVYGGIPVDSILVSR
jgi:hypothetical protein